ENDVDADQRRQPGEDCGERRELRREARLARGRDARGLAPEQVERHQRADEREHGPSADHDAVEHRPDALVGEQLQASPLACGYTWLPGPAALRGGARGWPVRLAPGAYPPPRPSPLDPHQTVPWKQRERQGAQHLADPAGRWRGDPGTG